MTGDLERAREHTFCAGVGDAGEALCAANMAFGLAKIHFVQRTLGLPPDATFVGAPDATVTRNRPRWNAGFGYGGRIRWSGDFAVLDEKPNACGMLVGALPFAPTESEMRERARAIAARGLTFEGISLDIDLWESNHFVDVCEVVDDRAGIDATALFVMHSSGHENREASARGPGLYHDKSPVLAAMARQFDTPWGPLAILEGDALAAWLAFVREAQAFAHRRREAVARALFGDFRTISNETHQGLVAANDVNIGCYVFEDATNALYPMTLSKDLPIFLVRPRPNLSEAVLESIGWAERADRLGVLDRVRGANLLPHGGGYSYSQFEGVVGVRENGPDERIFTLEPSGGGGPIEVSDVRALAHGYRGREVLERAVALDLCEPVVEARVRFVVRPE